MCKISLSITRMSGICVPDSYKTSQAPQDVGNSDVFPWWQGRHVSKTQPRYHFASYMAIMCPLMVLKGSWTSFLFSR